MEKSPINSDKDSNSEEDMKYINNNSIEDIIKSTFKVGENELSVDDKPNDLFFIEKDPEKSKPITDNIIPINNQPQIIPLFKVEYYKEEEHIIFTPCKIIYIDKFINKKFTIKISEVQKQRKNDNDNIIKKIETKFFSSLAKCINNKLKCANINIEFKSLPQCFITNSYKKVNKSMIDKTLEEIIYEYKDTEIKKYDNNEILLDYLKQEDNLSDKNIERLYNIFNSTIRNIFNEYLTSKEFDQSINELDKKGNNVEYIQKYINKAQNFVNLFSD